MEGSNRGSQEQWQKAWALELVCLDPNLIFNTQEITVGGREGRKKGRKERREGG